MTISITFRGKRVDNGEWVTGAYIHNSGKPFIISHEVIDWDDEFFAPEFWWRVDPSTVGQYTGLKDKDGKEIYEGDIITTDLGRNYLIVEYRNGAFMLNCNDGLEDYYDIFFATSEEPTEVYKYGEVIGNIYENPELLKGVIPCQNI